ncbi:FAD-binding domain-containing protein [Cristinia sonorae]|uniref:ferric-chelate reductase (NADPH) n=1 Tax=Cristinia sonorae TaxID=1940300 RepID=A0A8K0UY68_9AGAR|nr:FAD-binding domain-containing protein [Cristinia sonorae]
MAHGTPSSEAEPASPTKKKSAKTLANELGQNEFTKYTWYLYVSVFFLAALVNIATLLWAQYRRRKYTSSTTTSTTIKKGSISTSRVPAAILTATRIAAYRWRLPAINMTLLEVLLAVMYTTVLMCLEWTNTAGFISVWANRAGHLAAIQFPLIVALSGKNNIIGWITGISHEKLNLMHRVISRVVLLLVWIHLAGTYLHWLTGVHRYERFWIYSSWIVAGILSCLCQTFLVFLSWEPIRRRFYEAFYATHMVLVIVIMITTMYHIHTSDGLFDLHATPFFWPSFLAWGIDRVGRLIRTLLLNSLFKPQLDLGQVSLLSSDTLLITLTRPIPKALNWKAGQHMFVKFPSLRVEQSHPFTVMSIPEKGKKEQELVFLARVKEGFTKTLRDHVLEENGRSEVPVILDGPYGVPADVTPFATCVFVAGGSGVTFTLPRFEYLVNELNDNRACARRIVFVWAIRSRSHMRWVTKRLAETAARVPSHVSLSISIFLTNTSGSGDPSSTPPSLSGSSTPTTADDVEKKAASVSDDHSDEKVNDSESVEYGEEKFEKINVLVERPDIRNILEEEVNASEGPVTVDVSGPKSLVTTTRIALSSGFAGPMSVLKGAPTVQLNVEAFSL